MFFLSDDLTSMFFLAWVTLAGRCMLLRTVLTRLLTRQVGLISSIPLIVFTHQLARHRTSLHRATSPAHRSGYDPDTRA